MLSWAAAHMEETQFDEEISENNIERKGGEREKEESWFRYLSQEVKGCALPEEKHQKRHAFLPFFLAYLSHISRSSLRSSQTQHRSTKDVDPTLSQVPIPNQRSRITGSFPLLSIATGFELLKRFKILIFLFRSNPA